MNCPICLEGLKKAVRADCFHVFCSVCIDTWMKPISDEPGNTSCPICRCKITYLEEAEWLNADEPECPNNEDNQDLNESSNQDLNESSNQDFDQDSEELDPNDFDDYRGYLLAMFSLKLRNMPKKEFVPAVEQLIAVKIQDMEVEKERLRVSLEEQIVRIRSRIDDLDDKFERDLVTLYKSFETELVNESTKKKEIDHENEYIDFLADMSQSLSTQRPQVLDNNYVDCEKILQRMTYSCMGLRDFKNITVLMPETPVLYVQANERMLVGDGMHIWYQDNPKVRIPWSNNITIIEGRLYWTCPMYIGIYNLDLTLRKMLPNRFHVKKRIKAMYISKKTLKYVAPNGKVYRIEINGKPKVIEPRNFVTVAPDHQVVYVTKQAPYTYSIGSIAITRNKLANKVYVGKDCMVFCDKNSVEYRKFNGTSETYQDGCYVWNNKKLSMVVDAIERDVKSFIGPENGDKTVVLEIGPVNQMCERTITFKEIDHQK